MNVAVPLQGARRKVVGAENVEAAAAAQAAEADLNELGRELGVRFKGLSGDGRYLVFEVVNEREGLSQEEARSFAGEITQLVKAAPSETIRHLVTLAKGVILE